MHISCFLIILCLYSLLQKHTFLSLPNSCILYIHWAANQRGVNILVGFSLLTNSTELSKINKQNHGNAFGCYGPESVRWGVLGADNIQNSFCTPPATFSALGSHSKSSTCVSRSLIYWFQCQRDRQSGWNIPLYCLVNQTNWNLINAESAIRAAQLQPWH